MHNSNISNSWRQTVDRRLDRTAMVKLTTTVHRLHMLSNHSSLDKAKAEDCHQSCLSIHVEPKNSKDLCMQSSSH